MCDPVTAVLAVGTVVNFANGMNQAKAVGYAGQANRQIANNNAALSDMQASDAITRGVIEERNQRLITKNTIGQQRAAYGARGIQVNTGSPADVMADTAKFGELDALTIRYNAKRESEFYKGTAANERFAGEVGYQNAMNEKRYVKGQAIGSLLTGAGQVADKWYSSSASSGVTRSQSRPVYGMSNQYLGTIPGRR